MTAGAISPVRTSSTDFWAPCVFMPNSCYRSSAAILGAAFIQNIYGTSGMNGDTGEAAFAVRSDLTITIGFVKNGLLADNTGAHMKRLICTDIGIRLAREENKICSQQEWRTLYASNGIPAEQSKAEIEGTVYYRCPAWLDMTIIQAFSD